VRASVSGGVVLKGGYEAVEVFRWAEQVGQDEDGFDVDLEAICEGLEIVAAVSAAVGVIKFRGAGSVWVNV